MKKITFILAFIIALSSSAQSVVEITYLDMPATKIARFVELHKEIVNSSISEERTLKGHWVYRHWYGSGAAIVIYDVFDSAEDAIKDDALAAFQKNLAQMDEGEREEMTKKFQEWWSHFDGHWDEMRVIDFDNFYITREGVDWDKPFVAVVGQYNVKNINETARAYINWQIKPGVESGSLMGGGVSAHYKGAGLDIEVFQSYESLVDFAKHVESGDGGDADARKTFWENVQGHHVDQIYLHIGHLDNEGFNLAGANR